MNGSKDKKRQYSVYVYDSVCVCVCVMPSNQRKPWLSLSGFAASHSSRNAWLHSQMTHIPSSELKPGLNTNTHAHIHTSQARTFARSQIYAQINTSAHTDPTRCVCII